MNKQGYGSLFTNYNADTVRGRLAVPRGHGSTIKQTQTISEAKPVSSVAVASAMPAKADVGQAKQVKIQPRWRPSFKTATAKQEVVITRDQPLKVVAGRSDAGFVKTTPIYGYEELPLKETDSKHVAPKPKAKLDASLSQSPRTSFKTTSLQLVSRDDSSSTANDLERQRQVAVKQAAAQKRARQAEAKAAHEAKIELARRQAEYQANRMAHVKAEAENRAELIRQANEQTTKQTAKQADKQMTSQLEKVVQASKATKKPTAEKPAISFDPLPAGLPLANGISSAGAMASAISTDSQDNNDANSVGLIPSSGNEAVTTMANPAGNILNRLANVKITFTFKINKQRVLAVLRYLAISVIIIASAYLAWDTYSTNQAVKSSFDSPASAMSISGTNPATADQTAVSQEAKAAYTVPSDQPRYISIPAIGVNARVMSVGVNSKGNIDTPTNLNDTAWYDGSSKPGQDGQVFIDGHTSFSNSINAAFNDLPKLREGNQIVVETGNGTKYTYRIVTVKTVNADKVDMGEALNPPANAKKGLTLMTCTGTFNYRTQTADKRLVVYAVQI